MGSTEAPGRRRIPDRKAGRAAPSDVPAFTGRARQLATVTRTLADQPALILVEGEAGIGKTRLVRECLSCTEREGRIALVAMCPPLSEPFPLGPIVEAVRRLRPPVETLGLTPLAGALRPLWPDWADALPPTLEPLPDRAATRHRQLAAAAELLDRLAVDLIVVEDAHWADSSTLDLLMLLLARPDPTASLVVTFRPEEVAARSPLRRITSRRPARMAYVRVVLEPLGHTETGQLVGSMFGTEPVPDELVTRLHERTDGIPLALVETVALLADRPGGWAGRALEAVPVPPTVRDSVLERVERLAPAARRILQAAATLAEPADGWLLGRVAGLPADDAEVGLADALRSGLLCEAGAGQARFRHLLALRAVYQAIPFPDRHRLHSQAVEQLRRRDPPPVAQLARHCREAGDVAGWSWYAEAAAELAIASGDSRAAVALLPDLLTAPGHPPDRLARLARKLGEAAVYGKAAVGGHGRQVVATLRTVLAGGGLPAAERGEIRLLLAAMLAELGEAQAAYDEAEAALPDLVNRPDLTARAMLLLARPLTPTRTAARHLAWLERASVLAPQLRSGSERLRMAMSRAGALLLLGEEAGWHAAEEIPEAASSCPLEQRLIPQGLLFVARGATVWGRYGEARRRLRAVTELAQATDHRRVLETARAAAAQLDWYTGSWSPLSDTIQELLSRDDTHPLTRVELRLLQGLRELASGDRGSAEPRLREVLDEFAHRGLVAPEIVPATAALGRLRLADGAVAEALAVTAPVLEMVARKGLWLWATDLAPVRVEALVAAGRVADAEVLLRKLAGWLRSRAAPAPAAAAATCRAILAEAYRDRDSDRPSGAQPRRARPGEPARLFANAARAWAGLPRPYDELLAIERQGRCLLADGEAEQAVALLTKVELRLADLGARRDADRIAHLLRQQGVEVKRLWRGGQRGYGARLSPRELEVVRLVAGGRTNRQVAEALFLSPKTVTQHLSAAMRKLGVTSRTAVAMAAADAGLLGAARIKVDDGQLP